MITPRMITVDFLRKNHTFIHYFGLGFIQIKLGDVHRVHVYHDAVPAYVEEPHDHRYSFNSTIIHGGLKNTIYAEHMNGTPATIQFESCDENKPAPREKNFCFVLKACEFNVVVGGSYELMHDTFHTVTRINDLGACVTLLARGPILKQFARVIRFDGAQKICPFSRKMTDCEMWEIVADSITNNVGEIA